MEGALFERNFNVVKAFRSCIPSMKRVDPFMYTIVEVYFDVNFINSQALHCMSFFLITKELSYPDIDELEDHGSLFLNR